MMVDVKLSLTSDEIDSLTFFVEDSINCLVDFISVAEYKDLPEVFYSLFVLSKLYNAVDI